MNAFMKKKEKMLKKIIFEENRQIIITFSNNFAQEKRKL